MDSTPLSRVASTSSPSPWSDSSINPLPVDLHTHPLLSHCDEIAWSVDRIGEKYLEWSDIKPSLETILTFTTLYWLTDTYPSSIYTYRWISHHLHLCSFLY